MAIHLGRNLPPAAAPIRFPDLLAGIAGLLQGEKTLRMREEELREHYGVRFSFLVSSGKAALFLILRALKELHPERDTVLIPAYTCYSVPSAVVRTGLEIRLCDLDPATLDFDFGRLEEELRNPRLLCVISAHPFGLPADVGRLRTLAAEQGIAVVEDAAQAMGGESGGRKRGTLGDVGLFSLGRGKAITTVEGGIILTDDPTIGNRIERELRSIPGYTALECVRLVMYAAALLLLLHPRVYWLPRSLPFLKLGETRFDPSFRVKRMSPFQAGLARRWKQRLSDYHRIRAENAAGLSLPQAMPGSRGEREGPLRLPLLVDDGEARSRLLARSDAMGMGISKLYPDTVNNIDSLRSRFPGESFPGAERIARTILSLPVHPFVTRADIETIRMLIHG